MIALLLIILGTAVRVLPHTPNVTPIAATALFGGTYLNRRIALIIPLVAMIISDLVIGFDSLPSRLTVYGSFLLIGIIGLWLRRHRSVTNIVLAALSSSILFFLITNAGVWAFGSMYPKTFAGLIEAYTMGLPFLRNTLIGDLAYTAILFGAYQLVGNFATRPLAHLSLPD